MAVALLSRVQRRERLVRIFPPDTVTTCAAECPPEQAGLRSEDVEAIWRSVVQYYEAGINPAIALCLRRRGKIVIDRAIGHACGNDDSDGDSDGTLVPAAPDTLYNMFSASKMIVAMLVHLLVERGAISLDAPVARYIPPFAAGGKAGITVRQVLAHRAGIPRMSEPTTLDLLNDRPRIMRLLCAAPVKRRSRGRLAYHALTGGYILADIIERVTGQSLDEVVQQELTGPLGLEHFRYGVEPEDCPRVARHAVVGMPMPAVGRYIAHRALGIEMDEATRLSNHERFLTAVVPAGNLITTPRDGCRFMELLLRRGTLDGERIFAPESIDAAIAEQAYLEVDLTLGVPIRYGLGFMLGARRISPYGARTEQAFGHLGYSQVLLWADPERDISAALMPTGKTFMSLGLSRYFGVVQTIARRCKA